MGLTTFLMRLGILVPLNTRVVFRGRVLKREKDFMLSLWVAGDDDFVVGNFWVWDDGEPAAEEKKLWRRGQINPPVPGVF